MDLPEIPGYRIERLIAAGGMASVYLAEQISINRPVALKVMSPQLLGDPSFGERFIREARTVAQLTHPNFIAVHDVGRHGDYYYMAMEYLPGGSLKQLLQRGLALEDGLHIIRELASALHYAASHQFVHRDIKPDNVLLRQNLSAVLCDFGIARRMDVTSHLTQMGSVVGTPHYMSPEQAQATELDGRSDLYSLGVIVFEMLSGRVPYDGDSPVSTGVMHVNAPIPELPAEFAAFQPFIDRALAKHPDDRFQDGLEMIEALDELEDREHEFLQRLSDTVIFSQTELVDSEQNSGDGTAAALPLQRASGQSRAGRPRLRTGRTRTGRLRKRRGRPAKKVITLSVAATLGMGTTAWWLYQLGGSTGDMARGDLVAEPETNNAPVDPPVPAPAPPPADERIAPQLAEARRLAATGNYYLPPGNNALVRLQAALALDAESAGALALRRELNEQITAVARRHIAAQRLDEAALAVDALASNLAPADSLSTLREQLQQARDEQSAELARQESMTRAASPPETPKEQRAEDTTGVSAAAVERTRQETSRSTLLAEQLAAADRLLDADGVTRGNYRELAYLYRDMLRANPEDATARRGLTRVVDYCVAEARNGIAAGDLAEASGLVDYIARIAPQRAELSALREELALASARRSDVSRRLAAAATLLAQPYKKPGIFGNNRKPRQLLRQASGEIQGAIEAGGGEPEIAAAEDQLLEKYADIINLHIADGDYSEAREFMDDLEATRLSARQIAASRQLLENLERELEDLNPVTISSF